MDVDGAVAVLEPRAIFGFIAPYDQLQPFAQRVDHRDADAMQAARDLVGVAAFVGVVEFAAGVQLRHDDFGGRNAFFGVDADRDLAPAG